MNVRRYETVWLAGIVLTTAVLMNPSKSVAQEVPPESRAYENPSNSKVEFTGGISGWLLSQGQTKWSHDFSSLTYKDDSTNIMELSGQATLSKRWFARGSFGYGIMGNGTLVDDDFSSANGPLESRTTSNITGNNLWYMNGDVGAKLIQLPNHRGTIGFFTGIQYWYQQHEASGVVQTVCNPVTPLCNPANTGQDLAPGQKAITNTATWISWRLGVEGDYRVTRKLTLEGKFAFKPITSLSNDDIHHLRQQAGPTLPALQQDPSFSMTGTGIGADVDVGASYMVTPRFSINLGYRFWWNHVADGKVTVYPVGAAAGTINLNEFETYRHGMTLGLRYIF
jgi:opacity protein-like surface antigen